MGGSAAGDGMVTWPRLTDAAVLSAVLAADAVIDAAPHGDPAAPDSPQSVFECTVAPPRAWTFSAYIRHIITAAAKVGVSQKRVVAAYALALVRRVAGTGIVSVSRLTCHRLALSCFVVAHKIMVDTPLVCNSKWARIGGVDLEDINTCERTLLCVLQWRVLPTMDELCAAVFHPQAPLATPPGRLAALPPARLYTDLP